MNPRKTFFNQKSIFSSKIDLSPTSVMVGGKSKNKAKSAPDTPDQYQGVEYEEEGDETDVEDQEDEEVSTVSLQKEVKDSSAKHITTRKQRETRECELCSPKDKCAKKSTVASTAQPAADDTAAGADA